MLKNSTIAIAVLAALLVLVQADAARTATPLTTTRVASKLTRPPHMKQVPGDFDRAFIVQNSDGASIQDFQQERWSSVQRDPRRRLLMQPGSTGVADQE
jgi:hypothetical protein